MDSKEPVAVPIPNPPGGASAASAATEPSDPAKVPPGDPAPAAVPPRPRLVRDLWDALLPTFHYWMRTEVHVYAFSIAANVLLAFFPFLIVMVSMGSMVFSREVTVNTIDLALRDFFPSAMGDFLLRNLPRSQPVELLSMFILLFAANGIFEPLEVALNRAWGIRENRSFIRNQIVSLILIFVCGGLALLSLGLTAIRESTSNGFFIERIGLVFFYKLAAMPLTALGLLVIYLYLPNGRPPMGRVLPAAIGVGVLMEVLKSLTGWLWPWFDVKIQREYGVFRYSATLILLSFLGSMLVLAGAEWASRGHRFNDVERNGEH